jgi:hypothetical protein
MSKRFGQVEKDVAKLATLAATGKPLSGTRAKAVLKEIEELKPVLARFAARAAEKDEDKKVYGPKMCTKVSTWAPYADGIAGLEHGLDRPNSLDSIAAGYPLAVRLSMGLACSSVLGFRRFKRQTRHLRPLL